MTSTSEAQLWRTAILPLGSTIQQAIFSLETSSTQIVLVVSEGNRLAGTLTDGDIRRAFLKGLKLDSVIDDVIHRSPMAVPPEMSRDLVLQLMQINKIHQLPIVNQEGSVIGLHLWDTIIAPKEVANMMVIMAGGKGTRLRPHTENCPKPMLEVVGKPMLQHIIEKAKVDGFQNFVISLHYLGHMIEEHFGDGTKYGVRIDYLREDAPLGTAGCLSLLSNTPELPFIVTNGDVLTDIQYNEFLDYHSRHEASATMAVRQYEIQNQFGVVRTKGVEIEAFEEKPVYRSHVNAGIYVLEPCVLKYLEHQQHCDMPTLFERIKENSGKTIVYPMHEPWLDVGRPEDLIKANSKLSG
jgi:dTDP-glucose pyrophosphorylase/predicted transcriptional regulator